MSDKTTATAAPMPWYMRALWALAALGFAGMWVTRLDRALSGSGGAWDWVLVVLFPLTFLWCVANALGYGARPKA